MFQHIVKNVTKGTEVVEDAREMFDATSGKKYIPFASATKATSVVGIMYSLHLFITTILAITAEAPKVYYEFMRDVSMVVETDGYLFGQKYVDCILRYLDEGRYPSMVAIYRAGECPRIHSELKRAGGAGGGGDDGKKKLGGPKGTINFGPVTTPIAGEGSGIIKVKCNRFHGTPQTACTAGIPPNSGFPAGKVGLCAYQH